VARRTQRGHRALVALNVPGSCGRSSRRTSTAFINAPAAPEMVVEVHGTMRDVTCLSCGWRGPMPAVLDRVRNGKTTRHAAVAEAF
jgi:hypothetical protein